MGMNYGRGAFCPKINKDGVSSAIIRTGAVTMGGGAAGSTLGKIDAKVVMVSFATAGKDIRKTHGLGRTPAGKIPFFASSLIGLGVSKMAIVQGSSADTSQFIALKCFTTNARVKFIVF